VIEGLWWATGPVRMNHDSSKAIHYVSLLGLHYPTSDGAENTIDMLSN